MNETKHTPSGRGDELERMLTNASVTIPIEVFERRYLTPQMPVKSDFYKRFANPTGLGLLGFLMATTPISCTLMGWRGAAGGGAATIGFTYFFGGVLQVIAAIMEFILGNAFPFLVFASFGGFWLSFGATQTPEFNAQAFFIANAKTPEEEAAGLSEFYSSFAFALIFTAVLIAMFAICSLRTNLAFVFILVVLDAAVVCLATAYWTLAKGNVDAGATIDKAAGGLVFAACLVGWYLLFTMLLESVDFPLKLPVGDLSHRFKGASQRKSFTGGIKENSV